MTAALFETRSPKANKLSPSECNALVLSCEGLCKNLAREAAEFAGLLHHLDDLQHDAALACVEASRRYQPGQGTKFSTYATPCIKRHLLRCVEQLRPDATAVRFESWDVVPDEGSDAEEPAATLVLDPDQRAALDRIRPGDREAVRLVFCEGLSPDRAAEQIGVGVKDVKLMLRNAARSLGREKQWLAKPGLFILTEGDPDGQE